MNQQKYIVSAILLLLVGGVVYFSVKEFLHDKNLKNPSTNIDYKEPVDSLTESKPDGKRFFLSKCASCHNAFKDMVGPALSGLSDRGHWNDSKKLYNYIREPGFFEKNKYIDSLRHVYGSKHTAFPDLSDEEIDAILRYINVEYSRPVYNAVDQTSL